MLIVGNWKAYVDDAKQAKELVVLARRVAASGKHRVIVAPPAPYLGLLSKKGKSKLSFAAQDVSSAAGGARTGETTAAMLADFGVSYVIVGHSERRREGETDTLVATKAGQAFAAGLIPILCIGEKARDIDAQYLKELRAQLNAVITAVPQKHRAKIIVAYEPVWAIGKSALDAIQPGDLAEMVLYIRKALSEHVPAKEAAKMKVIYGGSVEPANIASLAKEGLVDGFLVGHASAEVKSFAALIKAFAA
ncbi:MAG TPA: triose-phosphate isomerase [Candidatus Paceibacterota bacterium]|jgi:triosephosphate isomerase